MIFEPVRPKILACWQIENVDPALASALELDADKHASIGLVTCDQDDSLYAALDHATKFASVDVVYAKSFYAGSSYASGPFSGEILGVLGAKHPDDIAEGLWAVRQALNEMFCFVKCPNTDGPLFFPQVISQTGKYLSGSAGIEPGEPLAYVIAPPLESVMGVDAALKAADVRMCQWFGPPTETNFGGAYLTGDLPSVTAAAKAFAGAIVEIAAKAMKGMRRPARERI